MQIQFFAYSNQSPSFPLLLNKHICAFIKTFLLEWGSTNIMLPQLKCRYFICCFCKAECTLKHSCFYKLTIGAFLLFISGFLRRKMDIISPRAVTGACDHSITCLFSVENCDLFKICCLHHFISFLIIIEYRQLVSILSLVYLSSLSMQDLTILTIPYITRLVAFARFPVTATTTSEYCFAFLAAFAKHW